MGSLFKHQTVRWIDRAGHRVPAGTPGARKRVQKSRKWWGKYREATGDERRAPLAADKQVALQMLAELERKEARRSVGLEDEQTDHARTPILQHVEDWLQALADAGASQRRRDDLAVRVRKLVALAGWKRLTDMSVDSANAALSKLTYRRGKSAGESRPISVQTRNDYIQHVKQFSAWCVPKRLAADPLRQLKRGNADADRRHDRRELTADEQATLIRATEASSVIRFYLDGPSRALLYELAFTTGFRRGELRSLTPLSFALDADPPTVTVTARHAKGRREAEQPLPSGIAGRLRSWLAAGKPLWPSLTRYTVRMFRADLEAAGIPYVVQGPGGPLYADFHATRHSYISDICRTDAPIKVLVELARHSDPRLTMKRYAKIRIHDKAKVVAQLPDPRNSGCTPGCTDPSLLASPPVAS
jgi:integrase